MDIIVSKNINKTSQDVQDETDIKTLIEWRTLLQDDINQMKSRILLLRKEIQINHSEELKSKYIRTNDAKQHCAIFLDIVNTRIREIRGNIDQKRNRGANKKQVGKYIDYLKTFRKLVKEKFGEEIFQQLDLEAKEILGDYNL